MQKRSLSRRGLLLTAAPALLATTATTGCWGGFGLTTGLWEWNAHFNNKWAKWGIMLPLIIFPVYGTAAFVDLLVINSIEFWSGNDPIPHPHRGAKAVRKTGKELQVVQTQNPHELAIVPADTTDPARAAFLLRRDDADNLELVRPDGKVVVRTRGNRQHVKLLDGLDQELAGLDAEDMQFVLGQGMNRESMAMAVETCLDERGELAQVTEFGVQLRSGILI